MRSSRQDAVADIVHLNCTAIETLARRALIADTSLAERFQNPRRFDVDSAGIWMHMRMAPSVYPTAVLEYNLHVTNTVHCLQANRYSITCTHAFATLQLCCASMYTYSTISSMIFGTSAVRSYYFINAWGQLCSWPAVPRLWHEPATLYPCRYQSS